MWVKITYFPHGTTTDNEQHIATWRNHWTLSEKWKQQSQERIHLIQGKTIDSVFCSDLQRALDSATLWFWDKYSIIQDKRIRECNYGIYNWTEKSFKHDMKKNIHIPYNQWESYYDVESRIRDFLIFLKNNYEWKHIVMISHEAPQLALEVILNNKTREEAIDEDRRKTKSWQPGWEYEIL